MRMRGWVMAMGVVGLALAAPVAVVPAAAAGHCPNSPGGKCPEKQKSGLKPRSSYTAEERKKIYDRALEICKKEFGRPSGVYRIDYESGRIWCTPPGY